MRGLSLATMLLAAGLSTASQARAAGEKVLYAFQGGTDGAVPEGRLLFSNGVLYGTTSQGGAPYNLGTLFQSSLDGFVNVLARFPGGNLGATPMAGLTELNGIFYGTTEYGGIPLCDTGFANEGCGVVFGFTPASGLLPIHVFKGSPTDGAQPLGDLTARNGVLFGTTTSDGVVSANRGSGTVFKVAPNSRERVLVTFGVSSNVYDGISPQSGLTPVGTLLYGTLPYGSGQLDSGQLYSTDNNGNVAFLYSFMTLGQTAVGDLVNVKGQLYGVTANGGVHGCGEIYRFDPSDSSFTVLYNFSYSTTDGCRPSAGLTSLNGKLFGVTEFGGGHNSGTIFSLSADGSEHILHSFGDSVDGAYPAAALIAVGGTLFGTTPSGGIWDSGTLYSFTPGAD